MIKIATTEKTINDSEGMAENLNAIGDDVVNSKREMSTIDKCS